MASKRFLFKSDKAFSKWRSNNFTYHGIYIILHIIFRLVQNCSSLEAVKSHWLSKKLFQDGFSEVWVPRKEIKPFSISWPLQLKPPPLCIGWTFWGGIGFMALCCTIREAFYSICTKSFTMEKVFILNPCRPLTFKLMSVFSLYGFSKFYWN